MDVQIYTIMKKMDILVDICVVHDRTLYAVIFERYNAKSNS